jgi:hypothetical protein
VVSLKLWCLLTVWVFRTYEVPPAFRHQRPAWKRNLKHLENSHSPGAEKAGPFGRHLSQRVAYRQFVAGVDDFVAAEAQSLHKVQLTSISSPQLPETEGLENRAFRRWA